MFLSDVNNIWSSNHSVGPGGGVVSLGVETGGVVEFAIVILLVKISLGSLGNSDEVVHVELVGEVLVEIILEMLDKAHVLLDEVVSADSWE